MNDVQSAYVEAIDAGRPQDSYAKIYGPPLRDPELGVVLIARYADAVRVLSDPTAFTNSSTLAPVRFRPTAEAMGALSKLFGYPPGLALLNGEQHRVARAAANRAFPKNATHVEPVLTDVIDALIAGVREKSLDADEVEIMAQFVRPLAAEVLRRTIGFAPSVAEDIRNRTDGQFELIWGNPTPDDQLAGANDTMAVWDHCAALVDDLAAMDPAERPDSYAARLLRQGLASDDVKTSLYSVVSAGFTTSSYALGNIIDETLQRSGAWQELHQHPDRIPAAVSDGLEKSTSVHGWLRQVDENAGDVVVGGVQLAPGERLLVLLGAANQDPERPAHTPDLTFSMGPHRCLGAAQAQFVLEGGLRRLTDEFPDMTLSRPSERFADVAFNGPRALWVRLRRPA